MKTTTKNILLLFFTFIPVFIYAQSYVLTGKIVNENNRSVSSASVQLEGTSHGTQTTSEGSFRLESLSSGNYTLRVSAIGYRTMIKSISVTNANTDLGSITINTEDHVIESVNVTGKYYHNYKMDSISGSLRLQSSLLETPQNIQVISNELLRDQMAVDMRDGVIRNVSGVTMIEHWSNLFARINMRGSRLPAFRNGMNVTGSWGPLTEDMSFVDRIEIVKGPAGFMMSNGDPSGLYNIVTKKPTGQEKGEAAVMFGSNDFYRATVDLDGSLNKSKKLLYRLNVMGQLAGSHRPNEYTNRYTIAPVISYQVDEKTKLTFEYTLQHATMSNVGSAYVFAKDGYAKVDRDFTLMERGIEPTIINDHSLFTNLTHDFNKDWKLTAQLAYYRYEQTGSSYWPDTLQNGQTINEKGDIRRGVGLWDALSENKFGQVYLNGFAKTGEVSHRILSGVDFGSKQYYADWTQGFTLDSLHRPFNIYNPVYGTKLNFQDFDRSKDIRVRGRGGYNEQSYIGLYLQDEIGFWENRIKLTLAGRLTHLTQASGTQTNSKLEQTHFTPRVGLNVTIDPFTSFYALYDQTFVPQNGILRNGKQPKPITGNNYELGLKRDWFDGKLSTTVSAYRILKNNTTAADPANAVGEQFVINIGQTTYKGVEFDLKGEVFRGLDAIVNYAWTDAEITKASESQLSTIGNKVPGYAAHNANAWLTYTILDGELSGFGIKAGANYQADRTTWAWEGATGLTPLPTYFRLDGGLYWHKNRVRVDLNVNNILNEYLYSGAAYSSYYYWQTEPGRNFRLGLSYKF